MSIEDSKMLVDDPDGSAEAQTDFKVLGTIKKNKLKKIQPTLPKWMCDGQGFLGDIEANSCNVDQFHQLLKPDLLPILKQNNIDKLFPVQRAIIPRLVESFANLKFVQPNDVCVLSPTGSGKTYGYVIPIVNHLMGRVVTQIRALVILPVSDLAVQVFKVFQQLCKGTTLRVGLATANKKQTDQQFYKSNWEIGTTLCLVDILVATPGKLLDLIQENRDFHLRHLQVLVIDEADRMMNETQFEWLKEIEKSVFESNSKRYCQCIWKPVATLNIEPLSACSSLNCKSLFKILFSATLTSDPEKLANLCLHYPILFNCITSEQSAANPRQTIPENLHELMIIIDHDKKPLVLWHLIKDLKYKKILCFTDSIQSTHRLYQLMKLIPELKAVEFSSKQTIQKRKKILRQFESGLVDIIISTDIFARGLDISGIGCVVCYDLPRNDTAYIHRVGRTARGGQSGTAISLITPNQLKHFTIISRRAHRSDRKQIEKLVVRNSDLKHLLPEYQKALKCLEANVKVELKDQSQRKRKQITQSKFVAKRNPKP